MWRGTEKQGGRQLLLEFEVLWGRQSNKLEGDPGFHQSKENGGPFEEVESTGAAIPEGTWKDWGGVSDKEVQRKVGMMVHWVMGDWLLVMCLAFGAGICWSHQWREQRLGGGRSSDEERVSASINPGFVGLGWCCPAPVVWAHPAGSVCQRLQSVQRLYWDSVDSPAGGVAVLWLASLNAAWARIGCFGQGCY